MRAIIYDEETLFSEAVASLFRERGHEVVATPSENYALLEIARLDPQIDACLLSVGSARDADLELISELRQVSPRTAIVALSTAADLAALLNVLSGGADGFCLKSDGIDEIEALLSRCVESHRRSPASFGKVALSPSATAASRRRESSHGIALTPKETRVLELLVDGAGTSKIASELGVGEATVRTHLQHLFSKFGVHTRLALIAEAVRSRAVEVKTPGRGGFSAAS